MQETIAVFLAFLPEPKVRAAKMHPFLAGLLLFILTISAFMLFIFGPLLALFGPLTAYGAMAATFTLLYVIYAWLVKKTGAKPTL